MKPELKINGWITVLIFLPITNAKCNAIENREDFKKVQNVNFAPASFDNFYNANVMIIFPLPLGGIM